MITQFQIYVIMFVLRGMFAHRLTIGLREKDDTEKIATSILLIICAFVYWIVAGWLVEPVNLILDALRGAE